MTKVPHYAGTTMRVNGKAVWTGKVGLAAHKLREPIGWEQPERIFVNSMGDLFHEAIPVEWIELRVRRHGALSTAHLSNSDQASGADATLHVQARRAAWCAARGFR